MNNTSILRKQNDINRLLINEAIILIKLEKPEINRQDTGISRTLKLSQITNGNNLILSVDTGHPYMLLIQKSLTEAFIFIIAS